MQSRLLFVLGAMVVVATACAKGTAFVGTGGSDPSGSGGDGKGGGSTTTVTSGSGETTTTTSGSGVTTTTTTSGSGGSGGTPCAGDPCKVTLPQCGCDPGEECSIKGSAVGCIPQGDLGLGQQCGVQGSDCGPGLVCVQTSKSISTCVKFCDDDAQCQAPGGLCLLTLNDGMGGSIPDVTLCTENCNPSNNVGCLAGTSCQLLQESMGLMRFLTRCGDAGVATQNASCMSSDDCAPTFGCFNTDPNDPNVNACFKWCKVGGPQNCPGGTICNALQTPILVGNDEYGVCF